MARRRTVRKESVLASTGSVSFGGRDDRRVVRNDLYPLPVDRTVELRFELGLDWDGEFDLDSEVIRGARVKPVVFVDEEKADLVDRDAMKEMISSLGAIYVRTPAVHVIRKRVKRDERHDVEIPLEESLRLFAEETRPEDAEEKIDYAVALAREADAGDEK
jgi:hypothetical protein